MLYPKKLECKDAHFHRISLHCPPIILSEANFKLAETALSRASQRPDIWDTADGVIDLGIGIAALLGGIYGVRIAGFLRQAGAKSKALREIIQGNELFKKQNSESAAAFKSAQEDQSSQTRQLVTQIKHS